MLSLMPLAVIVPNNQEGITYLTLAVLVALVTFLGLVLFMAKRYKRCPSNRVLVIYGKVGQRPIGVVHPRRRPVRAAAHPGLRLSEPGADPDRSAAARRAVDREHPRQRAQRVHRGGRHEPAMMQNAAIRLLGLDTAHVKKQAEEIIFGQLRQVIASMRIEDINRDREKFLHNIQSSLEPELKKIGLVLINVNITDITDESGYIEAIGQKAASQAIQQARGDVAEQERLGEMRVAEAERDKSDPGGRSPQSCARSARASAAARAGRAPGRPGQGAEGRRAARPPSRKTWKSRRPIAKSESPWPMPTPRPSPGETESQANVADAQAACR